MKREFLLEAFCGQTRLAVLEDCCDAGCLGQKLEAQAAEAGIALAYSRRFNCGKQFIPAGKVQQLYELCGITGRQVALSIQEAMQRG